LVSKAILGVIIGATGGAFWEVYQAIDVMIIRASIFGAVVWTIVAIVVWKVTKSPSAIAAPVYAAAMIAMCVTSLAIIIGDGGAVGLAAGSGAILGALCTGLLIELQRRFSRTGS